jgi:hypothetical protein
MTCCPIVRVKCKRTGATTLSQSYWTLSGPLSKPVRHVAKAQVPAGVKCAVMLGKKQVSALMPLDSERLQNAIDAAKKKVERSGCEVKGESWGNVPNVRTSPKYSDAPGEAIDKLKARVQKLRR